MDLSIIIVSFNTKDILQECLDSVYKNLSQKYSTEVIVVDNGSTDGTVEKIQNVKIKIIQNKKNLGFSRANNIGVKQAKGRYVLFLNSDTVLFRGTVEIIVKFMDSNQGTGAATCKVVLPNEKLDDAAHRGFPTPWNAFCHFSGLSRVFPRSRIFAGYSLGWIDLTTIHEIDACAGAFMMVRRSAGEEIGWWDEDFFWYGDDLDFCYRLKEKKWKIYYVPTVSILHYKGVSGGIKEISKNITKADPKTKALATKARFEAMKIFYKKHYTDRYPSIITWFVMTGINVKLKLSDKIEHI
ncbi:MAG: glycosyltransferase family 2 protein [Candidatus Levyibacteriota bacterium]|nr:MAG: glycosyltransferase family 2 protein [Candidatus Levybacteria bacterium]